MHVNISKIHAVCDCMYIDIIKIHAYSILYKQKHLFWMWLIAINCLTALIYRHKPYITAAFLVSKNNHYAAVFPINAILFILYECTHRIEAVDWL